MTRLINLCLRYTEDVRVKPLFPSDPLLSEHCVLDHVGSCCMMKLHHLIITLTHSPLSKSRSFYVCVPDRNIC